MMGKKDYELVAAAIAIQPDNTTRDAVANRLALLLALGNPRFKRAKFLKACNSEDGEK